MNKETAEFLVNISEHCGNQEADLRENYLGRGMYGNNTAAVVVDNYGQLLADILQYMADNVSDSEDGEVLAQTWEGGPVPDIDGGFRIDNMGRGVVIY
jgi:hypothetical protein